VRIGHEHHVLRLQIAVDDVLGVCSGERIGDLQVQVDHLGGRQLAAAALDALGQRLALEVLHDNVGSTVGLLAVVGDLDQAGVLDPVDGAGFIEEAGDELGIAGVLAVQDLDGDAALDGLVDRLVDRTHPTFTDTAYNAVGADHRGQITHCGQYAIIGSTTTITQRIGHAAQHRGEAARGRQSGGGGRADWQ